MNEDRTLSNVAFLTHVVYRCNRWGVYVRWLDNVIGGVVGPKNVNSWWRLILEGNIEQIGPRGKDNCPVDIAEAVETNRCVQALPESLRETIIEEHIVGGTRKQKADALGIETRTFLYRLHVAYPLLLGFFNDVAAGLDLPDLPE